MGTLERREDVIAELLPLVLHQRGRAVAVWGEAGVGKTHLLNELLAGAACKHVTVRAGSPVGRLLASLPAAQGLPAWAASAAGDAPELLRAQPDGLVAAVAAHLSRLAPFVLCLEDLHEADPTQLEFVARLGEAAARLRGVTLVVTSRVQPPAPFVTVRLPPLTFEEVKELLQAEAGAALPGAYLAWVFERAGGNPLYTKEYSRYLARSGHLWSDGARWRWREPPAELLPTTVETLLARRLAAAASTPAEERVLRVRAVMPTGSSRAAWQMAAGLERAEFDGAVERLEQSGILAGDGFSHPLLLEVAVKQLTPEVRAGLVRRALVALDDAPVLAAELVESAGLADVAAVTLLVRAAEASPDRLTAARFRARAAERAVGEERARLALQAAVVLEQFDLPAAIKSFELAFGTGFRDGNAVRAYVHALARLGAVATADDLLEVLPAGLRDLVDTGVLTVTMLNAAGEHQAAYAAWEELARSGAVGGPGAMLPPELLRAVAGSAVATGRMGEARELVAEGLKLGAAGDPVTPALEATEGLRVEFLSLKALLAFHEADYRAARAASAEVLTQPAVQAAPRQLSTVLLNHAAIARMLGEFGEMGECLERCLALRRNGGDGRAYAFALAALAELRIEQARFEEAEDHLTEAISTLTLYPPSRYLVNSHAMASSLYLAMGSVGAVTLAVAHAEQALTLARASANPRAVTEILFDASVANTRYGDAERGLELALEAGRLAAEEGGSPHDAACSAWAAGLAREALGEAQAAVSDLTVSHELLSSLGVPLESHKVGLELARIAGDETALREHLAWFDERGLGHGADRAREYLEALGQAGEAGRSGGGRFARSGGESPGAATAWALAVLGPVSLTDLTAEAAGGPRLVTGDKRLALLALLVDGRLDGVGHVATLDLLDALYGDLPEVRARASLKELVHAVRRDLHPALVVTAPGGYALGTGELDVEVFLRTRDTRLWRGPYCGGRAPAAHAGSSAYAALLGQATALVTTDPHEAARCGMILLEADPYDGEYLALRLRALHAAGDHARLERDYDRARVTLREVGEELPGSWAEYLGFE